MNKGEEISSAIEAVASNPKVAAAVSATPIMAGAASRFEIITGWLSVASMSVGIVTTIVVLGIQLIRLEQAWRGRNRPTASE